MITTRTRRSSHSRSSKRAYREFDRAVSAAEPHVRAELLAAAARHSAEHDAALPTRVQGSPRRQQLAVPAVG